MATAQNVKQTENMELCALSFLILFFALVIARWLSFDFRMFESYGIFALMAPIIGVAIGAASEKEKNFRFAPYALLITTGLVAVFNYLGINDEAFPAIGLKDTLEIAGITFGNGAGVPVMTWLVIMLLMGPLLFGYFVGGRIGALVDRQKALDGWWAILTGLVAASLVFSGTTFFNISPGFQLVVVGIGLVTFSLPSLPIPALSSAVIVLALGIPLFTEMNGPAEKAIWTPLYRVEIDHSPANHALVRVELNHALEESLPDASAKSKASAGHLEADTFFSTLQPKQVLILGTGVGSLVAPALKSGAESIDAVETEGKLLEIGTEVGHYSDAKNLKLIAQDPRVFLNGANKKYDLIVFGAPIGLGFSTAQQDRFARTREAYKRSLDLLSPDGTLIVVQGQQSVKNPEWLYKRIFVTLKEAGGHDPLVFADQTTNVSQRFFVLAQTDKQKLLSEKLEKAGLKAIAAPSELKNNPITDDQPYPYTRTGTAIFPYILLVAVMVALMLVSGPANQPADANGTIAAARALDYRHGQLFFLGTGFMLLCAGSLPPLFAIFGQNWLPVTLAVNITFLLVALSAHLGTKMSPTLNLQQMFYQALFLLVVLVWVIPQQQLLAFNPIVGILVLVFIAFMAIFRASLALTTVYAATKGGAQFLAFILLGIGFGAMLESVSWFLGLKALVVLAEVFFVISFNLMLSGNKASIVKATKPVEVEVRQIT